MREPCEGQKTCGGFADTWRGPSHFVVKIPANVNPADAAPMMCGGVTVYAPLKQYGAGTDRAKRVGVVGVGGLGHFAILFAKAMGAQVTAISHSARKKADAEAMGASRFIEVGDDAMTACQDYKQSLDLIICTTSELSNPSYPAEITEIDGLRDQTVHSRRSKRFSVFWRLEVTSYWSASPRAVSRPSTHSPSLEVRAVTGYTALSARPD